MHVHYVTLPESYFTPVKIQLSGREYELVSPSVASYLHYASLNNQFEQGKITEEEMVTKTVTIFFPFLDISSLHTKVLHYLFTVCLSTFSIDEQRIFFYEGKEFDFGKKEEKKEIVAEEGSLEWIKQQCNQNKASYIYIDLLKQISMLVKFYGFSHKEIMEMPYVWFLNYLSYKSKLEAEEDIRELYIAASSQSTDCKKVFEKLRIVGRLDCDVMNELSNAGRN